MRKFYFQDVPFHTKSYLIKDICIYITNEVTLDKLISNVVHTVEKNENWKNNNYPQI